MVKFTKEQIEKIKSTHAEVTDLQKTQDKLFEKLIKDLDFEEYSDAWRTDSDCYIFKNDNPANWLFDSIFNTTEEDLDKSIREIEQRWHIYDQNK